MLFFRFFFTSQNRNFTSLLSRIGNQMTKKVPNHMHELNLISTKSFLILIQKNSMSKSW